MRLGIIGGSGSAGIVPKRGPERLVPASTPWGMPSGPLWRWQSGRTEVLFLPRHGPDAAIPPHAVNYRANIWLLKAQGVDRVLGVNAVGGIAAACRPGVLVIPDQIIDYSWGRPHSFAGTREMPLRHVDFTDPFCANFRAQLLETAASLGLAVVPDGVYGVTQGPRLESAAEINRLERDGCTVVGMTAMPEAGLARELDLSYAICCVVVNQAAGRCPAGVSIHGQMAASLDAGMAGVGQLIDSLLAGPVRQ